LTLRVIEDGAGDPTWNMAFDEALLRTAGPPTLRLYGWNPHAVSLGYFQAAHDFADLPAAVPVVRRLTGGGAIWHGDELTFALVADAELLPTRIEAGYEFVHGAVRAALAMVGIPCAQKGAGHAPGARPASRWCFAEPGCFDLVVADGRKLLGSAQRRIRTPRARVLHHGSLVLRQPPATPFVAAVADFVPPDEVVTALRRGLAERLAVALGLSITRGAARPDELDAARRLQAIRYADPGFTRAR
jgi:lipoate-protein ligase A